MNQKLNYQTKTVFAGTQPSMPENIPDYKNMTTREVLEDQFARMDLKNATTAQQRQNPSFQGNSLSNQNGLWNKALKYGEYATSAAEQGLSAGTADEIEGLSQGLGYAVASLNKNWNKNNETFAEAFQRGYTQGRDYRRNVLKEGKQNAPHVMMGGEFTGTLVNPLSKIAAPNKLAPLSRQAAYNTKNALATGTISGIATVDNPDAQWTDIVGNVAKNTGANATGNWYTNKALGRAGNDTLRQILQFIPSHADSYIK